MTDEREPSEESAESREEYEGAGEVDETHELLSGEEDEPQSRGDAIDAWKEKYQSPEGGDGIPDTCEECGGAFRVEFLPESGTLYVCTDCGEGHFSASE